MMGKQTPSLLAGFKRLLFAPLAITLMAMGNTPACASMQKVVQKRAVRNKQALPTDTIYSVTDQMPKFKGGDEAMMKFLQENLKYPEEAKNSGHQGRVVVSFVVEKDGALTHIKVVRPVHPALDAEVVRVIKRMPKWLSGRQNGKRVRVKYSIPIYIHLQ